MISDLVVAGVIGGVILSITIAAAIIGFKTPKTKIKKDTRTKREIYNDYMKSEQWQLKRERALYLANYKCQRCGSKNHLQVHHLTYKNFMNEKDSDLKVLCHECHQMVHGRKF